MAISMGSASNPVVLDQYQTIVEVGWPLWDYATVSFGSSYNWFDGQTPVYNSLTGQFEFAQWWEEQTFLSPPLFTPLPYQFFDGTANATVIPPQVVTDPPVYAGKWGAKYLTRIDQDIDIGTSAKLRKKTFRRNEAGDLVPHVEWTSTANFPENLKEQIGWYTPKTYTFAPWQYYPPNEFEDEERSTLDFYIRDIEGFEIRDRHGDIVYVDEELPTFADVGTPYVNASTIDLYFWGYIYTSGGVKTRQLGEGYQWRVDAPPGDEANWPAPLNPVSWTDVLAGLIGNEVEFGNVEIPIYQLQFTVASPTRKKAEYGTYDSSPEAQAERARAEAARMTFKCVGAAMHKDEETVTILFERVIDK